MDDGLHKKYTGVSNRLILENLKKVAAKRSDALITRIPLIGMVNADEQNMKTLGRVFAGGRRKESASPAISQIRGRKIPQAIP